MAKKLSRISRQLLSAHPILSEGAARELGRIANCAARAYGTNSATEVVFQNIPAPKVIAFDGYHAESRTGIRASMAALKRFWSTYHYVPSYCKVALPLVQIAG